MRRRKSEVDVTKQTLAQADDAISLDPLSEPTATECEAGQGVGPSPFVRTERTVVEYHTQDHVGETVVLAEGQKAKRKYTKRKKASPGIAVSPTFIDRAAVRSARIQLATDVIDGKITSELAKVKDDRWARLESLAQEIENHLNEK